MSKPQVYTSLEERRQLYKLILRRTKTTPQTNPQGIDEDNSSALHKECQHDLRFIEESWRRLPNKSIGEMLKQKKRNKKIKKRNKIV